MVNRLELIKQRSLAKIKKVRGYNPTGIVSSGRSEYIKAWNEANKEKRRMYSLNWQKKHPERRKHITTRYRNNMSPERKIEEEKKKWQRIKAQSPEKREARLKRRRDSYAASKLSKNLPLYYANYAQFHLSMISWHNLLSRIKDSHRR